MGSGSAVITADNPVTLGEWVRVRLEKDLKVGKLVHSLTAHKRNNCKIAKFLELEFLLK